LAGETPALDCVGAVEAIGAVQRGVGDDDGVHAVSAGLGDDAVDLGHVDIGGDFEEDRHAPVSAARVSAIRPSRSSISSAPWSLRRPGVLGELILMVK